MGKHNAWDVIDWENARWVDETHTFSSLGETFFTPVPEVADRTHLWANDWYDDTVQEWLKEYLKGVDERIAAMSTSQEEPTGSRVTITFNRRLTHSEKHWFRLAAGKQGEIFDLKFNTTTLTRFDIGDGSYTDVTLTSTVDNPVAVVDTVSEWVEDNYLNVHPVSVHTHYPRIDKFRD